MNDVISAQQLFPGSTLLLRDIDSTSQISYSLKDFTSFTVITVSS